MSVLKMVRNKDFRNVNFLFAVLDKKSDSIFVNIPLINEHLFYTCFIRQSVGKAYF